MSSTTVGRSAHNVTNLASRDELKALAAQELDKLFVIYARGADSKVIEEQTRMCLGVYHSCGIPTEAIKVISDKNASARSRRGISKIQNLLQQGLVAAVLVTSVDRLERHQHRLTVLLRQMADVECVFSVATDCQS